MGYSPWGRKELNMTEATAHAERSPVLLDRRTRDSYTGQWAETSFPMYRIMQLCIFLKAWPGPQGCIKNTKAQCRC